MNTVSKVFLLASSLFLWQLSSVASAQFPSMGDGLSVTGKSSIEVAATRVRMQAKLQAVSGDARRALEHIRKMRTEATEKLVALKADEESITYSRTGLSAGSSGGSSQEAQMAAMMSMAMNGKPAKNKTEDKAPVTAECTLVVDWVIPESDNDAMILFLKRLEEKIDELDVLGKNQPKDISDAQAEMLDKMKQQSSRYGSQQAKLATTFRFVGEITNEVKQQLMKSAYDKATDSADTLATAAGGRRGKLIRLQVSPGSAREIYYGQQSQTNVPQEANEVLDANPGDLKYEVNLNASFEVEGQ